MRQKIRLLWAEDDVLMHPIIEFAFESQTDIDLRLLCSGEELVQAAQEDPPDLILLDVFMPHMDGPTTLLELRRNTLLKDVPIVFVTAQSDTQGMQDLLCLGAVGIINKPIHIATLPDQLRDFASTRSHSAAGKIDSGWQSPSPEIESMAQLREEYFDRILACLDDIRKNAKDCLAGDRSSAALAAIHFQAHTLAGSARTFGYAGIGDAARELEFATTITSASPQIDRQLLTDKVEALSSCAQELARVRSRQ